MHEQIILDKSIKNTLENMQLSKEKVKIYFLLYIKIFIIYNFFKN